MPSDRVALYLQDILDAIVLIRQWISDAGGAEAAVYRSELVRSAVERQLLIVSEAAIRIDRLAPDLGAAHAPEVNWAGVRGIGNVIRHRYHDADLQVVVDVLNNRLDQLDAACRRLLTLP